MNRRFTALAIVAAVGFVAAFAPSVRADVVIPAGETFAGARNIDHNVVNNGSIIGSAGDPIVFGPGSVVSGSGYFEHTIVEGVFAPGNSPAVTSGSNQAFGPTSTIVIELGGITPGFGNDNHDQINDSGAVLLAGGTLSVVSWNGFVPQLGDEFKIITWQTGLIGAFSNMTVDSAFTSQGITFSQQINNPVGPGNLTLIATAVPEAGSLLLIGAVSVIGAASWAWRKGSAMAGRRQLL